MQLPTTILTGARGYVGSLLAAAVRGRGGTAIELSRAGPVAFRLGEPIDPQIFRGAGALVHCAWDFGAVGGAANQGINIDGSLALFGAARAAGVPRIVFISSMSAFDGCVSQYGQAKLAVEKAADASGLVVIRPGLVWGRSPRGMVGALRKAAGLPLFTPLPGAGRQMCYLCHEDDLSELVCQMLLDSPPTRPILAACDQPQTFRRVLEQLAAPRKKVYVPVPTAAIALALRSMERLGLRPRVRSDSLVSLLNPDPHPDFSATYQCGVAFRPFSAIA